LRHLACAMSSRALRRAYPADLPAPASAGDDTDEQETEDDQQEAVVNAFAALAGDESSEADNESVGGGRTPSPVRPAVRQKKPATQTLSIEEEIARFQATNAAAASGTSADHAESNDAACDSLLDRVLQCEARFFDSERELRNLFGSAALQAETSTQPARGRNRGAAVAAQRIKRVRKSILVKAKDDWPVVPLGQLGLSMRFDSNAGEFSFCWGADYVSMQEQFEACARTHDPQALATLLQLQPWHIGTLLQMSDIYRLHGEFPIAADLVSRAIYAMEGNFHPKFDILSGRPACYLDLNLPENASFFRALRRHMQFVGRRGCTRTALELCKLALKITRSPWPSGPSRYATEALLHLEHFAFRASIPQFVLQFASSYDYTNNTSRGDEMIPLINSVLMLPSWAFAVALAKYLTDNRRDLFTDVVLVNTIVDTSDTTPSELVQQSLLLYPEVLERILVKIGSNEPRKGRWKKVLGHLHFREARLRLEDESGLRKLVDIFIERSGTLWKEEQVLDWVSANAELLVDKLDEGLCVTDEFDKARNEFLARCKSDAYGVSKLDVSEFGDQGAVLPAGVDVEENVAVQRAANPFQGQNPLVAFLSSLLPWVNAGDAPPPQPE
ncbi:hypothetical protein PBRA_000118, partial [Plasmodiophora brassicae]